MGSAASALPAPSPRQAVPSALGLCLHDCEQRTYSGRRGNDAARTEGPFALPKQAQDGLAAALAALAPSGVAIARRLIGARDDQELMPDELVGFGRRLLGPRRQSGAARRTARDLLAGLGYGRPAILRSPSGAPLWPPGIVGSMAHDSEVAVAVVARSAAFDALGIDIEPAERLPSDIIELVATPAERARYPAAIIESRVLFAAKEAVYKALFPIDGVFLDFHEVDIDLDGRRARTRHGREIEIVTMSEPRVCAVAFRRL